MRHSANTQTYINAISKMDDIYAPQDWKGKNVKAHQVNAFNLFLGYFHSVYLTDKKFNGYGSNDWAVGKNETTNNKGAKADKIFKDATPHEALFHSEHVLSAPYKEKLKAVKVFYALLLYSGARISQLWQFFDDLEHNREVIDPERGKVHVSDLIEDMGDCVRIRAFYISWNTKKNRFTSKRTTYYYFPLELKNAVMNYRNPYQYDSLVDKMTGEWRKKDKKPTFKISSEVGNDDGTD